jgi:hypothetical protein
MTVHGPVSFENSLAHWFTHLLKSSLPYYFDSLRFITSCQRVSLSYPNEMAFLVRQLLIRFCLSWLKQGGLKDSGEHHCSKKEEEYRGEELNQSPSFL